MTDRVVIIGAGIGGLAAALDLTARGYAVTVCEQASTVGGKMRQLAPAGRPIDAGPTVLTMRPVFEGLFRDAGTELTEHLTLEPAALIARHAWSDGTTLDLHHDIDASYEAIRAFAGPREADGYRAFLDYAARIHANVDDVFIRAQRPTAWRVMRQLGLAAVPRLMKIDARRTVWQSLGDFFRDARLRQLFGRYATYAGNSPFFAPATFNLIAWVEQQGIWRVRGGIWALANAMAERIVALGGEIRCDTPVRSLRIEAGRCVGVELDDGPLAAAAVIFNGDPQALCDGGLGEPARRATPGIKPAERSLSALTWCIDAPTEGFDLAHHNVFFGDDYAGEFDDIFKHRRLPTNPTVYVCAQDRGDAMPSAQAQRGPERLLVLTNAPAAADTHPLAAEEIDRCERATFEHLRRLGLTVSPASPAMRTTPTDWARLFPSSGGALYGPAAMAWNSTLKRPGAASAIPGLYLAGGAVHPGAGVPMVAMSGRMAAEQIASDQPLTRPSHPAAMSGGTSTRSATTAATR